MSKESLDGSVRLPAGCIVISIAMIVAGAGTGWLCVSAIRATPKPAPVAKQQATQKRALQEDAHPSIGQAFEAGMLAGQVYKRSGLSKPTEREIDGFALRAIDEINPPPQLRGEAVAKFRRGFGWGWWQN